MAEKKESKKVPAKKPDMTVSEASSLVAGMAKQYRAFARLAECLDVVAQAERVEATCKRRMDELQERVVQAEAESNVQIDNFRKATAKAAEKYKTSIDAKNQELGALIEQINEAKEKADEAQAYAERNLNAAKAGLEEQILEKKGELAEVEGKLQKAQKDLNRLAKRIAG